MPVRKVSNRGGNIIGYFPSIKLGKMVAFESTIERDLIYLLDFASEVISFCEQPYTIGYLDGGLKRRYTPDFHVQLADGRHITVECKPEALVCAEENQRKFAAGETWAEEHGWTYQVITEKAVRDGCLLANVRLLTQYARHAIPTTVKHKILNVLDPSGGIGGIGAVSAVVCAVPGVEPGLAVAAIFQMAFYHELLVVGLHERPIDLDIGIRKSSPGGEQHEHPSLFG